MHHQRCVCPQCGTTLRVKDRAYLGRPVPCPDCRTLLVFKAGNDEHLEVRLAEAEAPEVVAERISSGAMIAERLRGWATNVKVVSWGTTIVVAITIATVALWPKRPVSKPTGASSVASVEPASKEKSLPEPKIAAPSEPGPWAARESDSPEDRLERLGLRLTDYLNRQKTWPAEQPARSFLVELEQPSDTQDLRRIVPEFLNPLLKQTATSDGAGVTHYVGVAGVGDDAPELPVDHPRAGIFGTGRATRPEDVTDGLSQTLLLIGVESKLGPWAEPGIATIRPLTEEPYLHGPDGFGTGQNDGMFVLLADGSVKFLAAKTHPVIMRRMAAMADGLPLDLSVPGDPAPSLAQQEPADAAEVAPVVTSQVPVAIVEPLPAVDLDAALAQPLKQFRQAQAVPRRELLDILEEMLGAPIRYDAQALGAAADVLDQKVSLDVQDTTVAELIGKLLDKTELTYDRETDGLRLRKKLAEK